MNKYEIVTKLWDRDDFCDGLKKLCHPKTEICTTFCCNYPDMQYKLIGLSKIHFDNVKEIKNESDGKLFSFGETYLYIYFSNEETEGKGVYKKKMVSRVSMLGLLENADIVEEYGI